MIISASERSIYFPDMADLSWEEISASLMRAEVVAQGTQGAGRQLTPTIYTEARQISSSGIFRVANFPILPDAFPIELQIRNRNGADGFRRSHLGTGWIPLDPTDFSVDEDTSEIYLVRLPGFTTGTRERQSSLRTTPAAPTHFLELKAKYAAGFDFNASPLSGDAAVIKAAIAGIASTLASPANQGMSSFELKNFYSVQYDGGRSAAAVTSKGASSQVEEFLIALRRFRPRGQFV